MNDYLEFLESKRIKYEETGFVISRERVHHRLFDFQRDIVIWALKKGRACIFAGTGLGKTLMQVEWAKHVYEHIHRDILILAPLAVTYQTRAEAATVGINITICRSQEDVKPGINITNYDILHKFDAAHFGGIILDESSILKSFTGKIRTDIITAFRDTPYKLACTATPAPNDYMELGNHADFLGVMTRTEMLSMFFVHDGGDTSKWRLKGHCKNLFWQWMASWSCMLSNPIDLGYNVNGFNLPPLRINEIIVGQNGYIHKTKGLIDRRAARRDSLNERIEKSAEIVNQFDEPCIIWCDLNTESEALTKQINGAVEIKGANDRDYKEQSLIDFSNGNIKKLVTKPSIAGFGMNWQHCSKIVFAGLSDSFEEYYQAVRRCWRFGQKKPVDVYIVTSEKEGDVVRNIKRKEKEFKEMLSGMISATQEITKNNIKSTVRIENTYNTFKESGKSWTAYLGDSCEIIKQIPDESIHYSVFSPPFAQLYVYSDSIRDMGNCKNNDEFYEHFKYLIDDLYRITKTGRSLSFHCIDMPSLKERDGVIGLKDFSGELIKIFQDAGFIYHSRVTIWKDPAVEMQRTKALGVLHKQLKKDSIMSRVGIPDYLITMRKPGVNQEPITHTDSEYSVNKWQNIASPVWMDINQSNTLQRESARADDDEKHICPLQLDVIERCIELYSNKNDVVFDPFMGIGSVPYQALKMGRQTIGIELKKEYYDQAVLNIRNAEFSSRTQQISLETIFKQKQLMTE